MKVDYSKWKTRSLSIENLKLDIKNPRFSYQSTKVMNQTEIIKYLVANHAVYELAKDIAINGYLLNEEPIVCKEGETYVVLEGNRRVAACKILLNPYKYLSSQRAKELTKYDKLNDKLTCYIAPNRRDADILIFNKHTGTPLQKWDKVSQDAFLVNLIKTENLSVEEVAYKLNVTLSEIRKALRRYTIHQYRLNSTCKCNRILINNLFKFFVWREVSKSFTRSIIEFIFNPLNLFVGYFTKVLTLWDILPDKPVGVFIGTTFP